MILYKKRRSAYIASKKIQKLFYNKKTLKPVSSRDAIGLLFFNELVNYVQLEYGKRFFKYR
jgi:hypothetical protein